MRAGRDMAWAPRGSSRSPFGSAAQKPSQIRRCGCALSTIPLFGSEHVSDRYFGALPTDCVTFLLNSGFSTRCLAILHFFSHSTVGV